MMTRSFIWFLFVVLLATPTVAADLTYYVLNKERSQLRFVANNAGTPVEGRFKSFDAVIQFDRDRLEQSSIAAHVDIASVEVGDKTIKASLGLPEWLAIEAFPVARLRTTKIIRMPNSDNYYADALLSLKNIEAPVTLNFQLKSRGNHEIAEGYLTLSRKAFGIGQEDLVANKAIADVVRVEFRMVASKQ